MGLSTFFTRVEITPSGWRLARWMIWWITPGLGKPDRFSLSRQNEATVENLPSCASAKAANLAAQRRFVFLPDLLGVK
jgi:hypothetical protein